MSQRILNVLPVAFDTASTGLNYFVEHSLNTLEIFPVFYDNSRQLIPLSELVLFKPTAPDEVQIAWSGAQAGTMYLMSFADKIFDIQSKIELMEKDILALGVMNESKLSKETYTQYRLFFDQRNAATDKKFEEMQTQIDQLTQRVDRL